MFWLLDFCVFYFVKMVKAIEFGVYGLYGAIFNLDLLCKVLSSKNAKDYEDESIIIIGWLPPNIQKWATLGVIFLSNSSLLSD